MTVNAATRALTTVVAVCLSLALSSPPAVAQAPQADLLRLPFPQYDGGLTPYSFELGYPLMTLIYDSLMWRDAEGVPRPWLARSVRRSRGGRRLTVRLRPRARWHDGRRVTADDVAFTFRYVAARPHPRFTPQLVDVERVRATGRLTVTIDLRRPSLGFEDQPLADLPILPRHLWRDLPAGRRAPIGLAVGSGPYRLVHASRADGYVLRGNGEYFLAVPRVREIRVPIIGDAQQAYDALRERKVDMVPLTLAGREAARLGSGLGIAVRRGPWYSGTALVLNTRRAPFDSTPARRAVAASLDLQRIARNVAPAEPAVGGFLHPASRWAVDAVLHTVDVDAARQAIDDIGLPTVRVLAPESDPVRAEAGRQVVLALRRAGAAATLVELPSAELGRALGEDGSRPDFEAAITPIPPLVSYDPGYLRALFGSDRTTAPLNVSGRRSAAFEAAARRVAAAPTPTARRQAILAELQLLARDAASIPLFFPQGALAYRSEIYDGWTFVRGAGILDKRSFLPARAAASPGEAAASRERRTPEPAGDEGGADSALGVVDVIDVIDVISIVALVVVVVLAVIALRQRRAT